VTNTIIVPQRPARHWRLIANGVVVAVVLTCLALVGSLWHRRANAPPAGVNATLTAATRPRPVDVPMKATSSGTAYARSTLALTVARQLNAGIRRQKPTTSPLTTGAGLKSCLTALAVGPAEVMLADLGTFEGRSAAVIVLGRQRQPKEIWVVSPSCQPGADGMQFFQRLP
jgi:hypothetical protein